MQNCLGIGRTGICSVYSTSESEIAGRAGIAGIVVIELDGLWTCIPV